MPDEVPVGMAMMKALQKRSQIENRIITSLSHMDRDAAFSIIMSFMPLGELEVIADFQECSLRGCE